MSRALPSRAGRIAEDHPDLWAAYAALGEAAAKAGPLSARERRLVKLALSVGAQSEGAVHSHTRRALAEGRRRDLAAGRTLVGPHRIDLEAHWAAKGIAARDASTGEQKALLISLVLANARALAAEGGAAPVLLLDEVAAHLDAGRRAALYDEIGALGAQAFLTGTDPELFDHLAGRAQMIAVADAGGESVLSVAGGDSA